MDEMQKFMHNAFWHESQVVFTFGSDVPLVGGEPPISNKRAVISSLNLQNLNDFLIQNLKVKLRSFSVGDTLRSAEAPPPELQVSRAEDEGADLESPIGKYLFSTVEGEGEVKTTAISFFHFEPSEDDTPPPEAGSTSEMASMSGNDNGHGGGGHADGVRNGDNQVKASPVVQMVNMVNRRLEELRNDPNLRVPIVAASPNWLSGATNGDFKTQGCPVIPPIPVPADLRCSSSPGLWPITLPDLPRELQSMTGDGVTVFILDTLPKRKEITRAAEGAEENNLLLLDVDNNVTFNYNRLPDSLDVASPTQPATGKDIDGRLIGFRMPDHGLFIAGIIRDLAPNANVECIRVLNDWCVGDGATLTKALEDIQNRMSQINPDTGKQGDLYKKPVVINLSLVIPADNEVVGQGIDLNLGGPNNVRAGLRKAMHTLVDLGAVLVASAANEADTRKGSKAMNAMRLRPDALYPAAFVYPPDSISGIIPVGAVDKNGNASSYSCYPGIRGVATYGGEVPTPYKRRVSDCLTEARKIDGLIGIYSSLSYPALSLDDCRSTYPVPNANGWAYWIGTSFATPIVTAIASRVLELNLRGKLSPIVVNVPSTVTNTIINSIARRQTIWDDLNPNVHPMGSASGNMILAVQQCLPAETEDEDEDEDEDMQINVTVVRRANGRNK